MSVVALLISAASALAAPIDEAKKLYIDGDYEGAVARLEVLKAKTPKDGNVNYYLGASLLALDRRSEAHEALELAESRGMAEASLLLAQMSLDEYLVDDAEEHIDTYKRLTKKNKKSSQTADLDEMSSQLLMMRNMLERVERIEVVDSIVVEADNFFEYYKISPEAGTIGFASINGEETVSYTPQNRREIIYSATDSLGMSRLMISGILDDGSMERPTPLDDDLGEGGNAKYPFMMADGMTLYYANDGENSLGGYDIFMTRRSDDGFLQPQNIGMPYNSPDDDYLLAIDEATGAGWWATDRNHIPGKVTIYVFVPSDMRVNCDPSAPNIADLARISSIKATQPAGADYSALFAKMSAIRRDDGKTGTEKDFELSLGDGRVYHSMADFRNPSARNSMKELLLLKAETDATQATLDELREHYRAGDKRVGNQIFSLEQRLAERQYRMKQIRNSVIRQERENR